MKKALLFSIIGLMALSCSKSTSDVTPTPTTTPTPVVFCKLNQYVSSELLGGATYDFAYDASGAVTRYTATVVGGTTKTVLTQTFTYDATGQLATGNQTYAIDGKVQPGGGPQKYTYTNGLLTKIDYLTSAGATFATATLTYDANKRLTGLAYKNSSSGYSSTNKYEYDATGNCTRYTNSDSDGYTDEVVSTYDSSKNPEQVLAKRLPFDFVTQIPWRTNVALTTKDTYNDGTGPDITTGKRTNIKTDAKGYVISATYTDNYGATTETYTLTDCN